MKTVKSFFVLASLALLQTLLVANATAATVTEDEYLIFYTHDMLGSPVAVSDDKGRVLWYENTEPFGKSLGRVSQSGEQFPDSDKTDTHSRVGYTGHEYDLNTDLVYMKARFYDADIGRFYSLDPVGFVESYPGTFARYTYVENNPYGATDPTGESLVTYLGGWASESWEGMTGSGDGTFNSGYLLGALFDGYDFSSGASGFANAVIEDTMLVLDVVTVGNASVARQTINAGVMGGKSVGAGKHTSDVGKKSRNKPPEPLSQAEGRPHSIIEKPGKSGQYTTHYGNGTWKQYRGSGNDHSVIQRPNVKEAGTNVTPDGRVFIDKGRVRHVRPDEVPGR